MHQAKKDSQNEGVIGKVRLMWERIQKFVDRIESRIALWQLARGAGVVTAGALSGWLSSGVALIDRFGAYGWFTAGLTGALLATAILATFSYARKRFAEAKLLNRASENRASDNINPLEKEFHRKRINIQDLIHPVTRGISNKEFTDCELVGPANIALVDDCSLNGVSFGNCDFILVKIDTFVNNVVPIRGVSIRGGGILNATIFVHPSIFDMVKETPGIYFVNQTGDGEIDSRQPQGIATKTQP